MPYYRLECLDCKHSDEFFAALTDWDKLKKGAVPYPTTCPKCKSKRFVRDLSKMAGTVKPGTDGAANRIKNQVKADMSRLAGGDMEFLANVAGVNDRRQNASGVKYMKDVKGKAAVKRKG